ncbi:thiamine pyrophosphate-binding protein [soil metagenome]
MLGARALVQVLEESGVRHIFGLPGDTGMALYDELLNKTGAITHIMTRDERSASFMADVYARASGRIGVCEGPSGGGATYIVPGVAEAQGSAVPLLCMTSDTPVSQRGRGVLTELDQESLFRPVTKWTHRIDSPATMAEAARRAIRLATSGRPGAVHLSLPTDTLEGETPDESVYGDDSFGVAPSMRIRPDADLVERAARVIESARRPVIVAGGGVLISDACDALTTFAETIGIPVATSINGKGSIAETSPVAIGVVGGNGAWSFTNQAVADADLVIFAGSRTDSTTTHHWSVPQPVDGPLAIQIDVDPWEIGNNYRMAVGLHADARLAFLDLMAAISSPETLLARNQERIHALGTAKANHWAAVERESRQRSRPIKPQVVVRAMRNILGDDVMIVADPGTPTPYLAAQYELRRAGRTTIIPRAHGGLGYAIPGVVGAAVAAPEKRIIGMTGDGSFGMSCGELETITRLGLPVVIIQCSNGSFGWIKELQHLYHRDRYFSVDFDTVDYAAIARGFGFQARHIEDPDSVEPTLRQALDDGRPYFLNIVTESQITETPPVAAWQEAEAGLKVGGRVS